MFMHIYVAIMMVMLKICILYSIITEETINAVKGLKYGRSAGPDLLINNFPNKWTEGVIVPIHKKSSKHLVDKYRGVTLVSTNCLQDYITAGFHFGLILLIEILFEEQYVFRSGPSTIDSIFILNSLVDLALSKGENIHCVFIDFRKAFAYLS